MFVYGFEAALSRKRVVASTRQPAVTRELEYLEEALSAHAKQAEWRMNPKAPGSRRLEAGRRPVQSVRTPIRLSRSFKWRAPGTCAAFAAATASWLRGGWRPRIPSADATRNVARSPDRGVAPPISVSLWSATNVKVRTYTGGFAPERHCGRGAAPVVACSVSTMTD